MKRSIILGLASAAVVVIAMGSAASVVEAKAKKVIYGADGSRYECVWNPYRVKAWSKKHHRGWVTKKRRECKKVS